MASALGRALHHWLSKPNVERVTLWLIYGSLAVLGTGLMMAGVAVALVVAVAFRGQEPIIGPTPEEIQVHCQPVIDWIVAGIETSGTHPGQTSSEHAALLDELPYSWRLDGSTLRIGELEAGGEWPHPLYEYNWFAWGVVGGARLPDGVTQASADRGALPARDRVAPVGDGQTPSPPRTAS